MAETKLTITDLRKIISKQMSLSEETASRFLAALFPAIIDGLKTDQQVRISGLGVFKLVRIAPRKSVNVHSGETIILDGYNKVTFVPESYIREQINEPFADLEAIRVDEDGHPLEPQSTLPGIDPRARFDEQADEIKSILAELNKEEKEAERVPTLQKTDDLQAVQDVQGSQNALNNQNDPNSSESPEAPEAQVSTSRFRGWIVALVTILILLAMLVTGYFILVNKLEDWANKLGTQDSEELMEPELEAEMLEVEPLLPIDSVTANEDSLVASTDSIAAKPDTTYEPSILGIETVQAGSRLAQIARRYYGDPDKWKVIYEENKNVIKDPNNLKAGTKLRIPRLQDK